MQQQKSIYTASFLLFLLPTHISLLISHSAFKVQINQKACVCYIMTVIYNEINARITFPIAAMIIIKSRATQVYIYQEYMARLVPYIINSALAFSLSLNLTLSHGPKGSSNHSDAAERSPLLVNCRDRKLGLTTTCALCSKHHIQHAWNTHSVGKAALLKKVCEKPKRIHACV